MFSISSSTRVGRSSLFSRSPASPMFFLTLFILSFASTRANSRRTGRRRKQAGSGFLISRICIFYACTADRPFASLPSSCLSSPSLGGTWTNRLRWSNAGCPPEDTAYRIQTTSRSSLDRRRRQPMGRGDDRESRAYVCSHTQVAHRRRRENTNSQQHERAEHPIRSRRFAAFFVPIFTCELRGRRRH